MKHFRFLWMYLTDKRFRFYLEHTIRYALRFHSIWYGSGASDALMFDALYAYKVGLNTPRATRNDLPESFGGGE